MKWATIFEQVAARPEAIADIAGRNGLTTAEIVQQVERQTSCAGSNYDLARKAKDALSRQARRQTAESEEAERDASRRSEMGKKLREEVRDEIEDKAKEAAKKTLEERQKQEQAQREQAQRDAQRAQAQREQAQRAQAQREQAQRAQAQRTTDRPATLATGQRVSPSAPQVKKPRSGFARLLRLALGAAGLVALLLVVRAARQAAGPGGGGSTGPTVPPTCAPLVMERRKCPWTPEGYGVEPCGPGFCWDGGPHGSLACKQEVAVENSHQSDLSNLVCNDGYVPERDPCTNVILRCVKQ
jgi:hypothetical protein